jgi:8-oxo-dGTP diphosphatase
MERYTQPIKLGKIFFNWRGDTMKINGTNIILLNEQEEVLLHLRDDKPDIPYPNRWGLPGGHIDEPETPDECILREIKEELGLELQQVRLFVAAERSYGTEHTYWVRAHFRVEDITLTEGQGVQWFPYLEIQQMPLIYEDNRILDDFFTQRPFEEKQMTLGSSSAPWKRSAQEFPIEPTRNGALKRVLIRHEEVQSALMFLNEVFVAPDETIGRHQHEDMEEIFYFIDGEGVMELGEEIQLVKPGDRVIVPLQTPHVLQNTGEREMRFVCFGVKVLPQAIGNG